QQARQHLERRGLARAVGPEKADALTGADRKRQLVDRARRLVLAPEQGAQRRPRAGGTLVDPVLLDQFFDFDLCGHPWPWALQALQRNSKMPWCIVSASSPSCAPSP